MYVADLGAEAAATAPATTTGLDWFKAITGAITQTYAQRQAAEVAKKQAEALKIPGVTVPPAPSYITEVVKPTNLPLIIGGVAAAAVVVYLLTRERY